METGVGRIDSGFRMLLLPAIISLLVAFGSAIAAGTPLVLAIASITGKIAVSAVF